MIVDEGTSNSGTTAFFGSVSTDAVVKDAARTTRDCRLSGRHMKIVKSRLLKCAATRWLQSRRVCGNVAQGGVESRQVPCPSCIIMNHVVFVWLCFRYCIGVTPYCFLNKF